jgi:MFS family permease
VSALEVPVAPAAAAGATATPAGSRTWLRVGALMFAVAWGGNEFTPLLVMYREVSHLSALTVNALLGAYVLGIVPALLIGGPLSDRWGRRPLLLPAAPLGVVGSLVLAVGPPRSRPSRPGGCCRGWRSGSSWRSGRRGSPSCAPRQAPRRRVRAGRPCR